MSEKRGGRRDIVGALQARVAELEHQLAQAKARDGNLAGKLETERALRESEMRFRTLAELSSDWYWEQDEDLRFVCPCPGLYEISGILPASYLGKRRWEIEGVAAASEAERQRADTCVERREPFFDVAITKRMQDGTLRHGLISGVPIVDDAGRFRGYRGVGRDVTTQKAAEEAMRESEARFRTLTELSADWYWEQDEELRFALISDGASRACGVRAEQLLGKRPWECRYMVPSGGSWEPHRADLYAHRPFRDLLLHCLGDHGTCRIVCVSGTPVFDSEGHFRGYRGVSRDVTERERAAEAVLESEQQVRLAVEYGGIGIWDVGLGNDTIRWSRNIGPMFGLPHDRREISKAELDHYVHPEDRARLDDAWQDWRAGRGGFGIEHRIVRGDGSVRWVYQRGALFQPHDSGPQRVLGIIQDITDRKLAEEALREERKLGEERRIEEAHRQRDTLVREVHHRIKNNLQGVAGLLRRSVAQAGEAAAVLETAITQVRSVALVHGLHAKPRSAGVPLHDLLTEIARMVDQLVDCHVTLDDGMLDPSPVLLAEGEAVAAALILNEIISNGAKHARATAQQPLIWIRLSQDAEKVSVRVRNRGRLPKGLDFTSGAGLGTGLGLVRALMPREGMRIAFTQDGDVVEVVVSFLPPVVAPNDAGAPAGIRASVHAVSGLPN